MTVKELRKWLDENVPAGSPEEESLEIVFEKSRVKKIKKSRVEVESRKAKVEKKLVLDCRNAWCEKCKNFRGKRLEPGAGGFNTWHLVTCENPRAGQTLDNVIEYCGSTCMDYDPKHDFDRKMIEKEVVVKPAEFKTVDALVLS